MKTSNTTNTSNMTVRSAVLAASTFVVVAAMQSDLPGGTWFAVLNALAIGMATAAIPVVTT